MNPEGMPKPISPEIRAERELLRKRNILNLLRRGIKNPDMGTMKVLTDEQKLKLEVMLNKINASLDDESLENLEGSTLFDMYDYAISEKGSEIERTSLESITEALRL